MIISLVAAMAKHRVIGHQGQMPWHLPAELKYFKATTLGHTILMGRKTFASIGRALPGRRNLVLSRQTDLALPGCEVLPSIRAVQNATDDKEVLMVIGGATLYEQMLPLAERMVLTFINTQVQGDTFFPQWSNEQWQEISSTEHAADANNAYDFRCVELVRAGTEK